MTPAGGSWWEGLFRAVLGQPVVVLVLVGLLVAGGMGVSPFELPWPDSARAPLAVDALPDTGENQQIIFTEWPGRSPREVEDQITYPLTTALMGMPGVRATRSASMLGFSSIHLIFEDDVDFWWARTRALERLAALPPGLLPEGVTPTPGPDATALGQVFWYTLEGQDPSGRTVGGWDPDELRTLQDWTVRTALQAAPGVAEVASVGGFVREVQVDVDPDALVAHGLTLAEVADAVRRANLDVALRSLEINGVEYLVRVPGFVQDLSDIEEAQVVARGGRALRVGDLARVSRGPALRRGALDDEGGPAVGGVVVARVGANPKEVIEAVKARIARVQRALPARTLPDGTTSRVTIVPFYDRSTLIDETLGTLSGALQQQLLITALVVLAMMGSLRGAWLISSMLPLGVLGTFLIMKATGVEANVMALGGVAIAIGNMVDLGIVLVESMHARLAHARQDRLRALAEAAAEVAPAVLTSVLTTVVSFLPVFALTDAELKLFAPLAFTKTFAMGAALLLAFTALPVLARVTLAPPGPPRPGASAARTLALAGVAALLVHSWMPLGAEAGLLPNLALAGGLIFGLLLGFRAFERVHPRLLARALDHKPAFLALPAASVALGATLWLGLDGPLRLLPPALGESAPARALAEAVPGLGREYMPPFDEGAFLYMPTTMPHASMAEALDMLSQLDAAIAEVPEVDRVVGKVGRVESALDPAPISMIETLITYKPEHGLDAEGRRVRLWRPHVRSPGDIWDEIVAVAQLPGLTGAPELMPIGARQVMLRSGLRAPMGVKVQGPDLDSIQAFGLAIEALLRELPLLRPDTVLADRVVGKPYLEIVPDRRAIARHGLDLVDVQEALGLAVGGAELTRTVEGRERSAVRVRLMREERDSVEALEGLLLPTPGGAWLPLGQLAALRYVRGPQVIRSEDGFLTGHVLFDKVPEADALEVVAAVEARIEDALASGALVQPPGVSYALAGTWEDQVRSEERLRLLVPLSMALVFVLLHLQFGRVSTTLIVASGVAVACSGAFVALWLYGQPWFTELMGPTLAGVFSVGEVRLSVAAWIGLIALIGLATDDGVVMATILDQELRRSPPASRAALRERVLTAAARRVRPCLMTTATTLLALLPVLSSRGRGADVMVPLALPLAGGMAIELMTLFVVPVLYEAVEARRLARAA